MVTQPILNSLIFTTLQNWHFLTALQIGRKFQWLPDGLCYHSEATDITKKGNFSGFLCNILVPEEATEIDYILQEVTDFAYLELLISVASELILAPSMLISFFVHQKDLQIEAAADVPYLICSTRGCGLRTQEATYPTIIF